MQPRPHQLELAAKCVALLNDFKIAYLAAEERTGKTIAGLAAARDYLLQPQAKMPALCILVITKAKATSGWADTLEKFHPGLQVHITSYHSAYKHEGGGYSLVIIDEAHSTLSAYPKPGVIQQQIRKLCKGLPIIFMSATPYAQGFSQLFHQLQVSSFSPFRSYSNFYSWHSAYGRVYTIKIMGNDVAQYDRCNEKEVLEAVQHLFITATRAELGFEHEPEDEVHYIELGPDTKFAYNELLTHGIIETSAGMIVADNTSKLRTSLHQLEGGTIKIGEVGHVLNNREKIDYVLQKFGDSKNLVIMYNYKAELIKLSQVFKNATLLQATSYAEGVDLSWADHLVIYSQDFSTARHTQRRARQANLNRKTEIVVHFLLVKKALSEQVYKTVSLNKRNYIDSMFERTTL